MEEKYLNNEAALSKKKRRKDVEAPLSRNDDVIVFRSENEHDQSILQVSNRFNVDFLPIDSNKYIRIGKNSKNVSLILSSRNMNDSDNKTSLDQNFNYSHY
ncbi:hypothetical protein BpHYR1_021658 [Brachionus plicatilis]|uniref:Uncharacterized protein n=1 Tax=Brachionus plicatilis TaxID=10195 RepID=A0A3M7RV87_BRAPC|nr:hypothetical protein BpHYR1_021658 [Brachionus plicatilis]